ncbi:hypothetical protein F5B22DRAFT_645075 [Xylaria bambusicola]|uniref:uncharacterized protein n=1 Tax=Xylaria bambusicola TaxID=326684 RepID=UPI0020084FC9|nr:uncharacterized protein F5B22DRAFT_645075 [Xylaria bambusicola]KAI0518309.1 hypothetical protein F5B22DRAFT_645075 [Xylaria bambusicola]
MATPTKKWDDRANSHLFLSIVEVLDLSFTKENKDAIANMMNERYGHDVNWNGIRAWTNAVHTDIMMAMYEVLQPDKDHFTEIIKNLHAKGRRFSATAVKHAFLLRRLLLSFSSLALFSCLSRVLLAIPPLS